MRRGDRDFPPSPPPRHYVTPLERRECSTRHRPLVYQVYGSMPEAGNSFPGGFSPVRTSSHRPLRNNISPPGCRASYDDSLYASFSPPRRSPQTARVSRGHRSGSSSIFRPKQPSVIVARDSSNEESPLAPPTERSKLTSPESQSLRPKDISVSRNPVSAFPAKLHTILSSAEYNGYITWLPHGRAWRVLKPKQFEEIIPKFFRSTKYASFMRQVNGWGFKRIITPGPDFNAYWHELFLRGLPNLCDRMKRPQKTDPELKNEDPPDFYRVSKYSPLPDPEHASAQHVAHSSSMSSASSAATSKQHGKESPHCDEIESRRHHSSAGLDSYAENADGSAKVALDLSDLYDKEASKLSEADLHYLVQQNRALIKQAHLQQTCFRSIN